MEPSLTVGLLPRRLAIHFTHYQKKSGGGTYAPVSAELVGAIG